MNEISDKLKPFAVAFRDKLAAQLETAGRINVTIDCFLGVPERPNDTYLTHIISETLDTGESEFRFFLGNDSYEFEALDEKTNFNSKEHPDYQPWVDAFHARNAEKQAAWSKVWLPLLKMVEVGYLKHDGDLETIEDILDFADVVAKKLGFSTDHVIDKWVETGVLYEKKITKDIEANVTFRAFDRDRNEYIPNLDKLIAL